MTDLFREVRTQLGDFEIDVTDEGEIIISLSLSAQVQDKLNGIVEHIAQLQQTSSSQQLIRDGVRIAFIGSVNAGKSTLFNALLGKERVIVSAIAGTTRDSVEGTLHQDGVFWTLIDTAGLRVTNDVIEQEGIERSMAAAQGADLVLLIFDAARGHTTDEMRIYTELLEQYAGKCVLVATKCDMLPEPTPAVATTYYAQLKEHAQAQAVPVVHASGKSGEGISQVRQVLVDKIAKLFAAHTTPFLLNARQQALLLETATILEHAKKTVKGAIEYELLAHHLKEALARLSQVSGTAVSEEMMDKVFRDFCVGK